MNYLKPTVVVSTTFTVLFFFLFHPLIYAQSNKEQIQIKSIEFPDKVGLHEEILVKGYLDTNIKFQEHPRAKFNYTILPADAKTNKREPHLTKDVIIKRLQNGRLYFEQLITIKPSVFKINTQDIPPQSIVLIWPTSFKQTNNSVVEPYQQDIVLAPGPVRNNQFKKTPTVEVLSVQMPKEVAIDDVLEVVGYFKIVGEFKDYSKMGLKYELIPKGSAGGGKKDISKELSLRPIVSEDSLIFKHSIPVRELLRSKDVSDDILPGSIVLIWPTSFKIVGNPKGNKAVFEQAITISGGGKNEEANNTEVVPSKPKRKE